MDFFRKLTKERTKNLYAGLIVALLGVVAAIVYAAGFGASRPEFYNALALWLPIAGLVAFVVLVAIKSTAPFAAIPLWACSLVAFVVYLMAAYMHLAETFYSGINAETLKLLDLRFVLCLVLYLVCAVASNVVMWKKMVPEIMGGNAND